MIAKQTRYFDIGIGISISMAQIRKQSGKVLSTPSKVVADKKVVQSDGSQSAKPRRVPSSAPGPKDCQAEEDDLRIDGRKSKSPLMQVSASTLD